MKPVIGWLLAGLISAGMTGAVATATIVGNYIDQEPAEPVKIDVPTLELEKPKEPEPEPPLTENQENEKVVSSNTNVTNDNTTQLDHTTTQLNRITTSNATGLPDTISRHEWERRGGWKQLVEAAYLRAIDRGVTPMCGDGMCKTVLYYKITAVATDPCYATVEVALEVEGETKMQVVGADTISAPGPICDSTRSQAITVPPLSNLTQYLIEADKKYGLYQKIKGSSK